MSTEQEYLALKEKVETAQANVNKAEGALEQTMSTLKTKFKCSTVPAAKKKLAKLRSTAETTRDDYENAKEKFEEKWQTDEPADD